MFPKIGGFFPPNHPLKNRVFHDFNHRIFGVPKFLETPKWDRCNHSTWEFVRLVRIPLAALTLPNGRVLLDPAPMCLNLPRFCGSTEPEFLSRSKVQWFEISIIKKNYTSNIFPGSKMLPPKKKGRLVLAGLSPAPEKGAFPTSIWVNGHSSPTMPTWSIMTLSWRHTFEVRSGEVVVACESRPWINTYPVFNQDERKCCTWLVAQNQNRRVPSLPQQQMTRGIKTKHLNISTHPCPSSSGLYIEWVTHVLVRLLFSLQSYNLSHNDHP